MKPRRPRPEPETITVPVTVPLAQYRQAVRLTGAHTLLGLGGVLERWVADAAHAAREPGSWERWTLEAWLSEHPFPPDRRPERRPRGVPAPPLTL